MAQASVTVPERVTSGRAYDVNYRFVIPAGAPAFAEDYTVFVHAIDERGNRLWTSDHQPPTPTTRWQANSVIEYTRPMMVPRSAREGRATLHIGLYSPKTGERLPLSGQNVGQRSYRVAALEVQSEPAEVFFTEGWHSVEAPEDAQGLEWRWSKQNAVVWLRNRKHDSVLVIELDQPVALTTGPQQVQVRVGDSIVDTFDVPPSQRLVRRIQVSAAAIGDKETARISVHVDRTFVPAKLAQWPTGDKRELGVRVFSVRLEP